MKTAERILAEAYYDIYLLGCDLETCQSATASTGAEIRDNMLRAVEDNAEEYDQDWFPLVATPGIERQIAWDEIAEVIVDRCIDDVLDCLFV